jgi:hypothetical protein
MDFVKIASALPAAVKIAIEFLLFSWDAIEFFSRLGILFGFVVYGHVGIGCVQRGIAASDHDSRRKAFVGYILRRQCAIGICEKSFVV